VRRVRGSSVICALALAALGTTGCGPGFFLYELFKGDDDDKPATTEDAGVDAAAAPTPIPSVTATAKPAVDAGPCTIGTACTMPSGNEGICLLDGSCEPQKDNGETCVASWECTGGYCAWDAPSASGRCTSATNACKNTQPGCTEDAHACCEGSRCHPAEFGAQPQCEICSVTGIPCTDATASTCCSGTCSYGHCR
jgi:hypothetical protein